MIGKRGRITTTHNHAERAEMYKNISSSIFCIFALALPFTACPSELPLQNPGFEEPVDLQNGWTLSQHAGKAAYKTRIDEEVFIEGKRSLSMERTAEQVYGIASQIVPTQGHAGETMKLSAMLRTEKVGPGGWMLVVNFLTKAGSIIEQARSEAVSGDTDWKLVTVERAIPKDAYTLSVGIMLLDGGTGWVDDVKLTASKEAN